MIPPLSLYTLLEQPSATVVSELDTNTHPRFGNYIGGAVEEEDEDLREEGHGADAYVDYDEEEDAAAGQELMEVDGMTNSEIPQGHCLTYIV